ncbi:sensor histidine kinase [Streptomyces sp. H39-S7]|uniref:sensor histidine kinase n=1 Tax=Streptomyces sp. H39-S7 TaxID=3004357 RepID=UPI0022B0148C|nr:sensor histidine kinase [Streptomyces sp. H39-S7]MCZ4122514.1 sensor histidine kinase [Streptomyces sp. H39-S7]
MTRLRRTVRAWGTALGRVRLLVRAKLPPVAVDAALTAALLLATAGLSHRDLARSPSLMVFQWLLLLPLVWRRRAPLAVFGVLAAVAFLQWLAGAPLPADVALLIALYTVAAHSTRRRTLLAFAVLELGTLLAALTWATHGRTTQSFIALSAMVIAAAVIGVNMRTRRAYLAALEDRAGRLERERDQRAQLAVAGERARIAREMHDIVTHNLSVMVALADGAVFAQERHPEKAAAAMRQVSGTGRQAITDMRRFLGVLRADEPDALRHPMPGIAQLEPLAEQVRAAGLPTRLSVAGDPAVANAAAQLTVYRLVQEALTNTLKHAPAGTRADVRVRCSPVSVRVDVTDDGPATTTPTPPSGHGIAGMRERAAAYGGQLDAGPRPEGGWRVSAVLTLIPDQDEDAPQDGDAPHHADAQRAGGGAL